MEKPDYSKYADIKVSSLSFLWGYSRNKACYNRLINNNALTIKDIFEKYDSDSFVFPEHDKEANAQTRAIIELIRFYYLKSYLLIDVYLEKEIKPFVISKNDNKIYIETIQLLRSIGFERRQANGLAKYISKFIKEPMKLGDFLVYLHQKNHRITGIGMNEHEDLRIKLAMLVDYYTQRKYDEIKAVPRPLIPKEEQIEAESAMELSAYIKKLEQEKEDLLKRRFYIDKKIEIIQKELNLLNNRNKGKTL